MANPINWTREEENIFEENMFEEEEEDMVSIIPEDTWHRIAQNLPGKTAQEVASHYEDVCAIEVDLIDPGWRDEGAMYKGGPWTGIEHRNFLKGLEKYGKGGDWRSISKEFVISRTYTQVASHAQKYFLRQFQRQKKARWRRKKKSRIHPNTHGDP